MSNFKPGLYDLALDMKMPKMYGHELYDEMKKIDSRLKVCFMTATYQNYEALRAAFPTIEIECYTASLLILNCPCFSWLIYCYIYLI
jgi:CheY-like chemotaxis protein